MPKEVTMKISVCSDMIYGGMDLSEAIERIKAAGADTVEFWSWSGKNLEEAKAALKKFGVNISGFCIDSKNEDIAKAVADNILNSGSKEDFSVAVKESIEKAKDVGAGFLIVTLGNSIEELSYDEQMKNIRECLEYVKDDLEESGITLVLEPINRTERERYIAPYAMPVIELAKSVNSPCIKVLYDIYHQTVTGDFSLSELIGNIAYIGHIHISDVPGRHEPGTGTIDYNHILKEIDKSGYSGYIGLECVPTKALSEILKDLKNI